MRLTQRRWGGAFPSVPDLYCSCPVDRNDLRTAYYKESQYHNPQLATDPLIRKAVSDWRKYTIFYLKISTASLPAVRELLAFPNLYDPCTGAHRLW
jgi:hypothetical protein